MISRGKQLRIGSINALGQSQLVLSHCPIRKAYSGTMEAVSISPPTQQLQKQRHGFNLVESAIVLGIVGLVIGGIWLAAAEINERMKIQRTIEQLASIVNCVREKLEPWHVVSEATSGIRNLGCLPPDSVRRNYSSGYKISTAYWPRVSVGIDGDGEIYIGFFASAAEGNFKPGQCDRLTQAIANAFGSSGEYLVRIRTNQGGFVDYLPHQFSYAAAPDKCGDWPRFFFSIPKK